jgi:RimJ/RimL family protein N-acetyltransferase
LPEVAGELVAEGRLARAVHAVDGDERDTIVSCDPQHQLPNIGNHTISGRAADHAMDIRTARLLLRRWKPADREPFALMNADPEVMRYMVRPLSREESDAFVDRAESHFDEHGYGIWAVEIAGGAPFIGYVGLWRPDFAAHFTPAVEVGWRLDRPFWGHGYATEAALAAIQDGFKRARLAEIVSFTVPANVRSTRVMERIGMTRDPGGDFEHPKVPVGSPLRHHVLYRISAG